MNAPDVDKNWTLEEAYEAHERAIEADPSVFRSSVGPFWKWIALHNLDRLQRQFESGDKGALLEGIFECAMRDLRLPEWVQRAYIDRYREIVHFKAASWDDVFGKPHRKGLRLADARRRRKLWAPIWLRIRHIRDTELDTAIDEELFERVGEEFGIRKTLASELWYEAKKKHSA